MKTQAKQETQVILVSPIGQRPLSVPEAGLSVMLKRDGQRVSAEFEEGDRRAGSALQIIEWKLQAIPIDQISLPEAGLPVRLTVKGERLVSELQVITQALSQLRVDQIMDKDHPFAVYHPGIFVERLAARPSEPVVTEDSASVAG